MDKKRKQEMSLKTAEEALRKRLEKEKREKEMAEKRRKGAEEALARRKEKNVKNKARNKFKDYSFFSTFIFNK